MTQRLLTYLCIDTSGSMRGEPIEAVNTGLQSLLAALRPPPRPRQRPPKPHHL